MREHARLMHQRERIEVHLEQLKRRTLQSAATQRALAQGEDNADAAGRDLEALLHDIEAFADNSMQVAHAMRSLTGQYVDWAAAVLDHLVRVAVDDNFLRAALRLSRYVFEQRTHPRQATHNAPVCATNAEACGCDTDGSVRASCVTKRCFHPSIGAAASACCLRGSKRLG
jgi:hypothetical protein